MSQGGFGQKVDDVISKAVPELLRIVRQLTEAYPTKRFTLDGRLVGDIGEILAATHYDLNLYEDLQATYDGETSDGRRVQVKATMKDALSFSIGEIPDYYLGLFITPEGGIQEVFNGPGRVAHSCVARRKPTKNGLHMIRVEKLRQLSETVPPEDRIPPRQLRSNLEPI